jgi:hypothetical protein
MMHFYIKLKGNLILLMSDFFILIYLIYFIESKISFSKGYYFSMYLSIRQNLYKLMSLHPQDTYNSFNL